MAQVKKKLIDDGILNAANAVFLKHGFMHANMREIAKRAKISLSNLYNYYADKDALFVRVLQPVLHDFERLCEFGRTHRSKAAPFEAVDEKKENLRFAVKYIAKNRDQLRLLFNQSTGSSLEKYADYLAEEYVKNWDIYFADLYAKYPGKTFTKPSQFFLYNMAKLHLATVSRLLDSNYSKNDMLKLADELAVFLWHGGMGLINPK